MNSLEIAKILQSNSITRDYFKGVYPSNNIPTINQYPFCVVVNTDRSGQPGTHWIAIYVLNNNTAEYFDSFGENPNKDIGIYLEQFTNLNKNNKRIQSYFDNSCGAHVIYYLIQRCRGKSLKLILDELNSPYNDSLVKLFVYKLLSFS